MNREQRRQYNKKHKTNFSKQDFDMMEIYSRIRNGTATLDDFSQLPPGVAHIDNEMLVPNGTPVILNYDAIKSRPQKDLTPEFIAWVDAHKDQVMHVDREHASGSLVCLKEDEKVINPNAGPDDKNIGHTPWLWDVYSDFLYRDQYAHEWITLAEAEVRLKDYEDKGVEQSVPVEDEIKEYILNKKD